LCTRHFLVYVALNFGHFYRQKHFHPINHSSLFLAQTTCTFQRITRGLKHFYPTIFWHFFLSFFYSMMLCHLECGEKKNTNPRECWAKKILSLRFLVHFFFNSSKSVQDITLILSQIKKASFFFPFYQTFIRYFYNKVNRTQRWKRFLQSSFIDKEQNSLYRSSSRSNLF